MTKRRYRVEWAAPAVADLLQAAEFIRQDQPAAAKHLYTEVYRKTKLLRNHPMLGRVVPEFENRFLRELIVRPHRIIYHVVSNQRRIEILAVVHSSRLLPGT